MNCKGKQSWPSLIYYDNTCSEALKKLQNFLVQIEGFESR